MMALVPVPQGDRSYSPPGHNTKERASIPGRGLRSINSMWSISAPSLPVMPAADKADAEKELGIKRELDAYVAKLKAGSF